MDDKKEGKSTRRIRISARFDIPWRCSSSSNQLVQFCLLTGLPRRLVPTRVVRNVIRVHRPFVGFPLRICLSAKFRRGTSGLGSGTQRCDSAVAKPLVRNFVDAIPRGRRYTCRICTLRSQARTTIAPRCIVSRFLPETTRLVARGAYSISTNSIPDSFTLYTYIRLSLYE